MAPDFGGTEAAEEALLPVGAAAALAIAVAGAPVAEEEGEANALTKGNEIGEFVATEDGEAKGVMEGNRLASAVGVGAVDDVLGGGTQSTTRPLPPEPPMPHWPVVHADETR